ncbi:His-Xaa-Ser system protein HxsD [Shewanella aegiceratis]|uniref:His-Xaa-Ser system protein HxsD n=1 Tax=Shewanella aegiceratis TaxID=2864203 RepID=UPI001C65FDAF|nr:His-Xaa-Ser system protein HxsD [Shewanella aegiceratis]QYJ81723.1 His-Xaa-Ser system protein HxsD [Shewanella aegiceratis]
MSNSSDVAVSFDGEIFSQEAILKACYELASLAVFEVTRKNKNILVSVKKQKECLESIEEILNHLRTSVIDYQLREKISYKTQKIREVLIEAALSNSHKALENENK